MSCLSLLSIKHHKEYMEWLKQKLGYTTMEGWYKISKKDIKKMNIIINNITQYVKILNLSLDPYLNIIHIL